jgi:hypothetical protein
MGFLTSPIEGDEEMAREMADQKVPQIFHNLQQFEYFFNHGMMELLDQKSSENKVIESELSDQNQVHPLFFCISDTIVLYLSNSERYGLLGRDYLKQFLNQEDHWIVLFHYILGIFPDTDGISELFLSYDLMRSLEESPFTEEIHVLLKCQAFFPFLSLSVNWIEKSHD